MFPTCHPPTGDRNLRTALWHPAKTFFCDTKGYLAPGEEWQATIGRASTWGVEMGIEKGGWLPELRDIVKQDEPRIIAVDCQDIHQRTWVSCLDLEWHHSLDGYVMEGKQKIVELRKSES